jgi:hypothetical protein
MNEKKGLTIGAVRLMMWIAFLAVTVLAVVFNFTEFYVSGFFLSIVIVTVEMTILQKMLVGVQFLLSDEYKNSVSGRVVGVQGQKPLEN